MKGRGIFFALCVLGFVFTSMAQWSEPIFLSELNDWENGEVAKRPTLTEDQLFIYFIRGDYLWEARRTNTDELFTEQRIVSELGVGGDSILYSWVSTDGLRLYYQKARKDAQYWRDSIYVAVRNNREDLWTDLRELDELHMFLTRDKSPSLTADEEVILWISDRGRPTHDYIFWMADRPNPVNRFENLREVTELNDLGAQAVSSLSANGLNVYITLISEEGFAELWKGSRGSREEPFGNFEPMEELNQRGVATSSPWVSPDQRTIYFFQRWGDPGDISQMGICMSVWEDEPYEAAVKNLQEAIGLKEQAMGLIDQAGDREIEALYAIGALMGQEGFSKQEKRDFWQARLRILQAMTKQAVAKIQLRGGLRKLLEAAALIPAIEPEPESGPKLPEGSGQPMKKPLRK